MRNFLSWILLRAATALAIIAGAGAAVATTAPYTVVDLATTVRVASPLGQRLDESPDGRWTVFVTAARDIQSNRTTYTLNLVDLRSWRNALHTNSAGPPPAAVFTAATSTGGSAAVRDWVWSRNGQTIYFIARTEANHEIDQVYSIDVDTRAAAQLTQATAPVETFAVSDSASVIVYGIRQPPHAETSGVVDGVSLQALVRQLSGSDSSYPSKAFYVQEHGQPARPVAIPTLANTLWFPPLSLSPDGRWCVFPERLARADIPAEWESAYGEVLSGAFSPASRDLPNLTRRLRILNLQTGVSQPLANAPFVRAATYPDHRDWISWSPDSQQVVIAGSYLPLSVAPSDDERQRAATSSVIVVDITSGSVRSVATADANIDASPSFVWEANGTIRVLSAHDETSYSYETGAWSRIGTGTRGPSVHLRSQSAYDAFAAPKDLWAESEGHSQRLTTLNPNLRNRSFGAQRMISWQDRLDRNWTGTLILPPHYQSTREYALAIGLGAANSPAIPAQALVNREMIFLSPDCEDHHSAPVRERGLSPHESISICLDGAVENLARRHIIDDSKVGLLAFSYSGGSTLYALAFSDHIYRAASIVDSVQATPWQYTWAFNSQIPTSVAEYDGLNALPSQRANSFFTAPPFGSGWQDWFNTSPAFSLDRVYTPLRWEGHGPVGALQAWDTYAILNHMARPIELVTVPDAEHQIDRPREFVEYAGQIVDWFDFWLNDHEDSDPAKLEQYARWRHLRDQRDAVIQQPRPPRRQWSFRYARGVTSSDQR